VLWIHHEGRRFRGTIRSHSSGCRLREFLIPRNYPLLLVSITASLTLKCPAFSLYIIACNSQSFLKYAFHAFRKTSADYLEFVKEGEGPAVSPPIERRVNSSSVRLLRLNPCCFRDTRRGLHLAAHETREFCRSHAHWLESEFSEFPRKSGEEMARATSFASLSATRAGMPAGAQMPHQVVCTKSATPASAMDGTDGNPS